MQQQLEAIKDPDRTLALQEFWKEMISFCSFCYNMPLWFFVGSEERAYKMFYRYMWE